MKLLLQTTPDFNMITTQNIILQKDALKWLENEIRHISEIEKGDPLKLKINYFENNRPFKQEMVLDEIDYDKYQFINIGYFKGIKNRLDINLSSFN